MPFNVLPDGSFNLCEFFLFPFINPISFLALVISLVIQIDQVFAKDTDGDGIVDALDAQPDIASAIVLNLNESSDLNANGDALKKEGNYKDTFPNLVLPYTKKETTADKNGEWMVKLDKLKANASPSVLTVKGNNEIELGNVLVGEVWICSGQSNMEWSVARCANP